VNLPSLYPESMLDVLSTYEDVRNHLNIHSALKTFIENNISACLNFSLLTIQAGIEVEVLGAYEIEPVIAGDYFSVSMKYPLRVSPARGGPVELLNFNVNTKLRLKQAYTHLKRLLQNEAKDILFDIENAPFSVPGMEVYVSDLPGYRLVEVVDGSSVIVSGAGLEPLRLVSALEKSPPAISYIHEDMSVVPGLKDKLLNCPLVGLNTPWENSSTLAVGIGKTMSKAAVECIWRAYAELYGSYYRKVYDFELETEGIPEWRFKTAGCNWNQDCQYKGANLDTTTYMTYLLLEFDDGVYKDYLNISLPLVNHPPTIEVACQRVPVLSVFLCAVNSTDEDLVYGVDNLHLSVSVPIANVAREADYYGVAWAFSIADSYSGQQVTFTVRDEHGGVASEQRVLS
jgi:hypothetical protein